MSDSYSGRSSPQVSVYGSSSKPLTTTNIVSSPKQMASPKTPKVETTSKKKEKGNNKSENSNGPRPSFLGRLTQGLTSSGRRNTFASPSSPKLEISLSDNMLLLATRASQAPESMPNSARNSKTSQQPNSHHHHHQLNQNLTGSQRVLSNVTSINNDKTDGGDGATSELKNSSYSNSLDQMKDIETGSQSGETSPPPPGNDHHHPQTTHSMPTLIVANITLSPTLTATPVNNSGKNTNPQQLPSPASRISTSSSRERRMTWRKASPQEVSPPPIFPQNDLFLGPPATSGTNGSETSSMGRGSPIRDRLPLSAGIIDEENAGDGSRTPQSVMEGTPTLPSKASTKLNFVQRFPNASDEPLLQFHSCAWEKDILWHGRLYVTSTHLCFYSKILGNEIKLVIKMSEIISIEKSFVAGIIPNSISVYTVEKTYFFASFLKRDATFDFVNTLWCKQNLKEPCKETPENSIPEIGCDPLLLPLIPLIPISLKKESSQNGKIESSSVIVLPGKRTIKEWTLDICIMLAIFCSMIAYIDMGIKLYGLHLQVHTLKKFQDQPTSTLAFPDLPVQVESIKEKLKIEEIVESYLPPISIENKIEVQ